MSTFESMEVNDMEVIEPLTYIQQFYCNTNVFITGGTGFLGHLLIEKLLRSCPDILNIYVLVRDKLGKTVEERIETLVEDPLFDVVKKKDEGCMRKIVPVRGDVTLENLGLNDDDKKVLVENIDVVFHLAGTVKIAETLKAAVAVNVSGTYEVLKLCKTMKNLKSLVYVSTAYSHCRSAVISERFFTSPCEPKQLVNLAKNLNATLMEDLTNRLLRKYPNTFTFTKAVAEELLNEFGKDLPAAIMRPSIVISTYKEPVEGYVNIFYGLTGILTITSCGLLKSLQCDAEQTANVVPADMCVNAMIAISVDAARSFETRPTENNLEIPIYHYESSRDRPIKWGEFVEKTVEYGRKWPTSQAIWYNAVSLSKRYVCHLLLLIFYNFLPGIFGDFVMLLLARSPWYFKTFKSMYKMTTEFSFYTTNSFTFLSKRMHYLLDRMSPEDKALFFCDLRELNWDEYLETYQLGMRLYVLKDPMKTVKEARVKARRLYVLSYLFRIAFRLAVAFLLYYCIFG